MQIDWFTFGAQIVNFLLLVWLLKRFLYAPITRAMTERQQRIAERFEEADEKRERAEAEAAEYREKREELVAMRDRKLAEAEDAARARRGEMIEEARQEVEELERQWKEALNREEEAFLKDLTERASQETVRLAQRALEDLARAELEEEVVRVFLDRLHALDEERLTVISEAIEAEEGVATIRTAFRLEDDQRRSITETLETVTDLEVSTVFERDADLGFGIELRAGGQQIAWTLQSYFAEVEDRVRARIEAELPPQTSRSPDGSADAQMDPISTAHPSTDEE